MRRDDDPPDPGPDGPTCPKCEDGFGRYSDDGVRVTCEECGFTWDSEPLMMEDLRSYPSPELQREAYLAEVYGDTTEPDVVAKCPHGKPWGDCEDCDYLSDLAFDAARERRT